LADWVHLPERALRLAFFGTPEIARTILERLLAAKTDEVVLVVCQPDRPKGRGKKVEHPPVKELALSRGLEVLQPERLKDGELAAKMRGAKLDLAIVVAYGRILPEDVFAAPAFGTWNVHASLLPKHRGASPIQHAILAGDSETGVTLMQMTAGLDEGPMLLQKRIALSGDETAGSLTEALAKLGAEALIEGLIRAKRDGLALTPQDPALATFAPLLEKANGEIHWHDPADAIARRVRAFSPWPGAFVLQRDGQPLRIVRARVFPPPGSQISPPATFDQSAGTVVIAGDTLQVGTAAGLLQILELQPPGKRPMSAPEFLRGAGRHLRVGSLFPDR
jgi:methionyl-tRNA formyltransferase